MEDTKSDIDDEVEDYYIKKPKAYENIETNQSMNNKSNMPKVIAADYKRQGKGEINMSMREKKELLEKIVNKNKDKAENIKIKETKRENMVKLEEKIR